MASETHSDHHVSERVLQRCYSSVTVVLQRYYKVITVALQWYCSGVTVVLPAALACKDLMLAMTSMASCPFSFGSFPCSVLMT